MVLEWTLGLKGLAYSMTPGSTFFAAASVYISREHGTCALLSFQINVQGMNGSSWSGAITHEPYIFLRRNWFQFLLQQLCGGTNGRVVG